MRKRIPGANLALVAILWANGVFPSQNLTVSKIWGENVQVSFSIGDDQPVSGPRAGNESGRLAVSALLMVQTKVSIGHVGNLVVTAFGVVREVPLEWN